MSLNPPLNRKLRMGLVGGGQGSFIGRVHSIAACLDNRATVVAGAGAPRGGAEAEAGWAAAIGAASTPRSTATLS